MTTRKAKLSGEKMSAIKETIAGYREAGQTVPRGLVSRAKKIQETEPFKDVSVFMKFLGDDWDMIKRIACDPAHQYYNLVKDMLALIGNYGQMQFKNFHLKFEQDHGRFKDIATVRRSRKSQPRKKRKRTQDQSREEKVYISHLFFHLGD